MEIVYVHQVWPLSKTERRSYGRWRAEDEDLGLSSCYRIIEPVPSGCHILSLRCHLPVPSIHGVPLAEFSGAFHV
jgi:hypothetical protein